MRLYGYWRSSSSWRVRIALHHKGLPYDNVPVNLLEGAHRDDVHARRNPTRQVPVLEVDGHRISQSLAILEFLEERFPSPPLLPEDAFDRARARMLAEIVNSGIQPLQNISVLGYVEETFGADRGAWAREWIGRGLSALEAHVADTAGDFLVGDHPTIADACLVPQLYNARRFTMDLDRWPTLRRVEARCANLPAFTESHPDRMPDAR